MSKNKWVNPITEELFREGCFEKEIKTEVRKVTKEDGEEYIETVYTSVFRDKRPFNKVFIDRIRIFHEVFEGQSRTQLLFIIEAAMKKMVNKDYIYLGYQDYLEICKENEFKPTARQNFVRNRKWYLSNGILLKTNENGKYGLNTKYFYNGSLVDKESDNDSTRVPKQTS